MGGIFGGYFKAEFVDAGFGGRQGDGIGLSGYVSGGGDVGGDKGIIGGRGAAMAVGAVAAVARRACSAVRCSAAVGNARGEREKQHKSR